MVIKFYRESQLKLYYNAYHPVEILESLTIKTSSCCGRDRGVSMSSQMIDSHGPFTFVFKEGCEWFWLFTEVEYGDSPSVDFTHKVRDLEDEHEWWSPDSVYFRMEDIERVIFRIGSPGHRIHPRIGNRNYKALQENFPALIF